MEELERSSKPHVVVINSEPEFLEVVSSLLGEEGYEVSTTQIDQLPYGLILAEKPDAIMLDIVHGRQESWDLLEILDGDERTREIPLLVTSTDEALIARALARSKHRRSSGMVIKPMQLDALVEVIRRLAPYETHVG
jgi:CheY-like chemotaxis protein